MKSLGNRKDYKTTDKYVRNNLNKHKSRMEELISQGYNKKEASKIAYNEIVNNHGN